jgi:hypothetical protein
MIDVSDGLLADVGHIADASGVAADVLTDAFEVAEPLRAVGAALGADPMRFILNRWRRPRAGGHLPARDHPARMAGRRSARCQPVRA